MEYSAENLARSLGHRLTYCMITPLTVLDFVVNISLTISYGNF